MGKKNCWEFKECGRQPGGENTAELGQCPVVSSFKVHGVNSGINGGRACWAISGTFCGGQVQGTFIEKYKSCANCDFFILVAREEGQDLQSVGAILARVTG